MWKRLIHLVPIVLVLGLAQTSVLDAADLDDDPALAGWWKLDEASGLTAADSSGNGNHGTLIDMPGDQWVRGIKDGALEFVGGNVVNCGTGSSLNVTTEFTIAAWVKLAPGNDGYYAGIAGKLVTSPYSGFSLVRHSSNVFRLWVGNGTDDLASSAVSSNRTYTDTAWHHVVGVRKAGTNYLYVDGVKQQATSTTDFAPSTQYAFIGAQYSNYDDRYFKGIIDDVRLYSRALTDAEIKQLAFRSKAQDPDPPDGAQDVILPVLQWQTGDTAAFHDVYFGTDPDALQFVVRNLRVQMLYFHGPGITPGTTYYWRVDEVEVDGTTIYTGDVWSFTATPLIAYSPHPPDGAENVFPGVELRWGAGLGAAEHHLYLGDRLEDVDNGTAETDKGTTTDTTRSSGPLAPETTYYWRVDAFDGSTWHKGDIWSFTTSIGGAGILREWWLAIPEVTVGVLKNDPRYPDRPNSSEILSTFEGPVDWRDNYGSRLRAWLMPPESGDYTFWIATDDYGELWLSADADPANKQMIANVPGWVPSRDFDNTGGGVGGPSQKSDPQGLVKGNAYYIEGLMKEAGGGDNIAVAWQGPGIAGRQIISGNYLSLAPFAPLRAYGPTPANNAAEVTDTPTLRWTAGAKAAKHNVYFGTDSEAVANATTASTGIYRGQQNLDATSHTPTEVPLQWNTTYYWRIDEVNTVELDSPWTGNIWSFTVANFIIVEDFEEYDDFCNRIFYKWNDGWGYSADPGCGVTASTGNGTGSTVGNLSAPYAEQTVVHGDIQSMPFQYDNSGMGGKARYSEASREFATPQNWTRNDVKALTLWFRGETGNTPETLYVAVEDSAGQLRVANHPDPEALQVPGWQQWNIALTQFSGVNLASVKKLYIGVGNRSNPQAGGSGRLYIDDIRVYPARCVPSLAKPAADLSGNCIVDYADVEIISDQWLDSGFVVTPTNPGNSGLIAHYPLEGNANDVVGGHNGTTSGGVANYTTGKVGQALVLDGLDDYAGTTESLLNDMSAFTLAGWVSPRNPTDSRIGLFGQNDAIEFGFDGGNVSIWTAGGGIAAARWTLLDTAWHHVAAVGSGTGLRVYVDGQLAASGGSTTSNYGTSTYGFNIGGGGVWDDVDNWLSGKIDEVRIYSRALSGPEVAWLAGRTSPFSIPADLYQDDVIDFKDLAVLGDSWLDKIFWP